MKEILVRTFSKLHEHLESYEQRFTVFRGVPDVHYELIPRIGRSETRLRGKPHKTEKDMVKMFEERAIPHLTHLPKKSVGVDGADAASWGSCPAFGLVAQRIGCSIFRW